MMHVYKFYLNIMIKTLHIRGSFLGAEEQDAVKYHSRHNWSNLPKSTQKLYTPIGEYLKVGALGSNSV